MIASAVRTLDPSSEAAAERVRGAGRLGVDIPDGALAWLSDLAFDQVCPTPTMRVMPARTSDWCELCYLLAASVELSTIAGRADLGHKLHGLLPHLLFYPLGGLRQNKATVELRRRCQSFLDGNWQQLYEDAPPPLTQARRDSLRVERDARRGFAVDSRLEHTIEGVCIARLSQASKL